MNMGKEKHIDREEIKKTLKNFNTCVPFIIAMSDEYRQQLNMEIAEAGKDGIKRRRPYTAIKDRYTDFLSAESERQF